MYKFRKIGLISFLISVLLLLSACNGGKIDNSNLSSKDSITTNESQIEFPDGYIATVNDVPRFSDVAYVAIKDNIPDFTEKDMTTECYEKYTELDSLGRCGVTMACVGVEIMPTEERGSIGQVKPSGWHTVKYEIVDGKYLYNRCHLIGFQLTGENANTKNLITGTRYLNIEGMLPFENMIADYVKETKNHVLYRVTPIFDGSNLVARGVQMEALSVEDNGEGICFNIYAYNNQPGVLINYLTGESKLDDGVDFDNSSNEVSSKKDTYILNTSTKKYHKTDCQFANSIHENNKREFTGYTNELINQGYSGCKNCIK